MFVYPLYLQNRNVYLKRKPSSVCQYLITRVLGLCVIRFDIQMYETGLSECYSLYEETFLFVNDI